jgi:membrane protein
MPRWVRIMIDAGKGWMADNAFKHSAAVSFYTLFSLAPITIIAVGIAGYVFGKEVASRQLSSQVTQLVGNASAELIEKTSEAAIRTEGTVWSKAMGAFLLVVGATTVFAQLQASLNDIWGVTAKPSRSGWIVMIMRRLISFAMVLTVGFLLLTSLVLSTALTAAIALLEGWLTIAPWVLKLLDVGVGLVVITILFALLFKVLPDVKVNWREVWLGAFVTAALFTAGRMLVALYLGHSTVANSYGAAGALVALLMWVYYSCAILFFGAEFIKAHHVLHGHKIVPKKTAVLVRREIVETRST